jgi:malate synthase
VEAGRWPDFPATDRAARETDWRLAAAGSLPAELCVSGLESAQEAAALRDTLRRQAGDGGLRLRADTLRGTFELEDILHELRDLVCEVQADYDGYLVSFVQAFHAFPGFVLPDRADISPETHLLRSYTRLLARVCARRGAVLIGALTVDDPADEPEDDATIEAGDLLHVPQGRITEDGIRAAIRTAMAYLQRCDGGGADAAGLDAAVAAELARAQLWQWVRHPTGVLAHGEIVTPALFRRLLDEETDALDGQTGAAEARRAAERLAAIVLSESFTMRGLCG